MVAGGGSCMVAGGHAWLCGVCIIVGGVHGCRGCMVAGGHVWLWGGRHAWLRGACVVAGDGGVHGIRRDMVNERAVRILLECILVYSYLSAIIIS